MTKSVSYELKITRRRVWHRQSGERTASQLS